jgi:PAS domain S-box-containing protein
MLIVPEDRAEEANGIAERTLRGESVGQYESVRRRRSGELIDVLVGVAPIRDLQGRVIGACKTARDISQQKRIGREMAATLTELKDVRAALDEHSIVAITDAAGLITFANDRFCDISKYSREELIGRDHRIINSRYHSKEFFRYATAPRTDPTTGSTPRSSLGSARGASRPSTSRSAPTSRSGRRTSSSCCARPRSSRRRTRRWRRSCTPCPMT